MDLADALEPAQQPRRVGVDPDHLGGLVGDRDLDQLVELLVDATLQKGDQRCQATSGRPRLCNCSTSLELVERMLELLS